MDRICWVPRPRRWHWLWHHSLLAACRKECGPLLRAVVNPPRTRFAPVVPVRGGTGRERRFRPPVCSPSGLPCLRKAKKSTPYDATTTKRTSAANATEISQVAASATRGYVP